MSCLNHPSVTEGVQGCARCARPFCGNCLVLLSGHPFCAPCKEERLRNLMSGVAGPAFGGLDLASGWTRFAALFMDGLIVGIPLAIVAFLMFLGIAGLDVIGSQQPEDLGLYLTAQLAIGAFMLVAQTTIEASFLAWRGQTPGKILLGVKVVSPDGGPLTRGQAWGRAAVRNGMGILSCFGMLGDYLPGLLTQERTCVHDMAAKTRVIQIR